MTALFKLIRISNLIIIALGLSLFYYLILVPVHHNKLFTTLVPLTNFEFALFTISIMLVAAAGNIINDYFDFELDKEFKPERPLASGKISLDRAIYLHAILAFAGIAIGFYLGWKNNNFRIGYVYVIAVLLLYVYSAYLKKLPLVGNIVVSALAAFPFLLLLMFEANFLNTIHFDAGNYVFVILLWQVKFYAGFAFITNLAREVVKDLEDKEGDAKHEINTVAVQFGELATKFLVALILLILLGGIAYFINQFFQAKAIPDLTYLIIAVVLPVLAALILIIKAKNTGDYARISLMLKVIMVLGILSIPAFYFFHNLSQA